MVVLLNSKMFLIIYSSSICIMRINSHAAFVIQDLQPCTRWGFAFNQLYNGEHVQHYLSSYDHSRYNATARGVSTDAQRIDPVARE